MAEYTLEIKDLHVSVEGKEILKGIDLTVKSGEFHAVMGPNGTGKSTLAQAIMGHPKYEITKGSVTLNGEDVLEMEVDERARAGLFLAMQYPSEVTGVTTSEFCALQSTHAVKGDEFHDDIIKMDNFDVEMDKNIKRCLNEGHSGGKRNEIYNSCY